MLHNLITNFLKTQGVNVVWEYNKFMTYRINKEVLEIHDIYSEDARKGSMLDFVNFHVENILKGNPQVTLIEGYIDPLGSVDRSAFLLESWGMIKFKETEEYIYYRKEVGND